MSLGTHPVSSSRPSGVGLSSDKVRKIVELLKSDSLPYEKREKFLAVIRAVAEGDINIMNRLRLKALEFETFGVSKELPSLFDYEPVLRIPPMDEFVASREFLGRREVFPRIMDILVAADDPTVRHVTICAGKGVGKSYLCAALMARGAFLLRAYPHVRTIFNRPPDDFIAMVNMSVSANQAERVIFQKLKSFVRYSKCFPGTEIGKRELAFPNFVTALCGHSGYQVFYGFDVFWGCVDEVSHFDSTPDHDVAMEISEGIEASQLTRFPKDYKLIEISSPKSEDDFLVRSLLRVKERGKRVKIFRGDSDSDLAEVK